MLLNRYYLRVLEYIGCPYSRLLTVIMDGKKAGVFCGYSDKTQISPVDPGVLLFCPVRQEIVRVKNEGSPEPPRTRREGKILFFNPDVPLFMIARTGPR